MNTYKYEDLKIGLKESFSCTITEEMMDSFCSLSGDLNPLHMDNDFAMSHGFQGRVAYGMLSASLFSRLGGGVSPRKILPDSASGSKVCISCLHRRCA